MLTKSMQRAYVFIASEYKRTGMSPTLQECAMALGMTSKSNMQETVSRLVKRGYLRRLRRRARAIVPLVPLKTKVFRFDDAEKRLVELHSGPSAPPPTAGETSA